MKNPIKIVSIGLGLVFLTMSLTAFFSPQEFTDLINDSFLPNVIPLSAATFMIIIGISDLVVALSLIFGKFQKYILVWAMLWLVAVIVINIDFFNFLEHFGFLVIAMGLWMHAKNTA